MAVTIDGNSGVTSPDFEPSGSTTPTNGLFLPTTNALGFATNSTERLRLDASGNLGLGVTPSGWYTGKAVQIGGSTAIYNYSAAGNYQTRMYNNAYLNASGVDIYLNTNGATRYDQSGGQHTWYYAASGTAGAAISFTQAMTLDASGNLGIGSTSPVSRLEIAGSTPTLSVTPTTQNQATGINLRVLNAGTYGAARIEAVNNTTYDSNLVFYTNTTTSTTLVERARIDSSGNFLVGGTSGVGINTNGGYYVSLTALNTYTMTSHVSGSVSGSPYAYFYYANTYVGQISQNGTTGVNFTSASDERLKENIVDAPSALSSVNAIKVRSFDWKADGSHVDYGYIAQELLEIAPEAVSVHENPEQMMGVDFGKLTPRIVKAIQELTARLEALENK